jgi:hypothetical protein
MGMIMKKPGPFNPVNLPIRKTTAFSHWSAIWIEKETKTEKTNAPISTATLIISRKNNPPITADKQIRIVNEIGLSKFFDFIFIGF